MFGLIIGAVVSTLVGVTKVLSAVYLGVQGLKLVGELVTGIAKALGLIETNNPEELGDKALQAEEAGIQPEDFDSYAEYVRKVEEFELDPEKSRKFTPERKIEKGAELSAGMILEKSPQIPLELFTDLLAKNRSFFSDKWLSVFEAVKDEPEDFAAVVRYMSGEEKRPEQLSRAADILVGIEKSIDPNLSDIEAFKNIRRGERG